MVCVFPMKGPEKLRKWIAREGISQAGLARRVKKSSPLVSQWCSGWRIPGREAAIRIEEVTEGAVTVADWSCR